MELRVGGLVLPERRSRPEGWRTAHRTHEPKDGSEGFDFRGTYSEVEEPAALTLVLEDGRTSRTTFEQRGNETEVTTTFDADDSAPLDLQQQGWQAILDNYRQHVSNRGA